MSPDTFSALVLIEEEVLREQVHRLLRAHGFEVHAAAREADAGGWSGHRVDLLMVAELEACRRLRTAWETPILLLSHGDAEQRVAGLDAGADDCLSRPFLPRELVARLRSLACRPGPRRGDAIRAHADVRLDRRAHRAWRGERELELTPTEFALLDFLVENAGQVLGRSRIHTEVWGYDFGSASNGLGVYVGYLRRKLELSGEPRLVHTVRGVGYVLREA